MKKWKASFLAITLAVAVTACGAGSAATDAAAEEQKQAVEQAEETLLQGESSVQAEDAAVPQEEASAQSEDAAVPQEKASAQSEDAAAPREGTASQQETSAQEASKAAGEVIPVTSIGTIRIGQTEDAEAATGCTVLISENGMCAGLDVRGGGPASRDSQILNPLMAAQTVHAVLLSGGSAFGLGAANGVMQYLEEKGYGYDTGFAKVPLVVQSDIYDLSVGSASVRPDASMGYEAARHAFEDPNYKDGNYGAGCGASVGKIAGMDTAMKTGIGSYAVQIGDLQVGAIVVLNSLGDIYDHKTGEQVAGLLTEDKTALRSTMEHMKGSIEAVENKFVGNTAIAVIVTNASFSKAQLCKIAGMGHDGYARSINPVHTSADGDSIYAVSVGSVSADQDLVGSLAAETISEAILNAVRSADSAYGLMSASELGSMTTAEP